MTKAVKVVQSEKEVPVEVLAASIVAISQGIKKLRSGRLNDRALVLLIQHAAPSVGSTYKPGRISVTDVKAVLEGIEALERTYIRKPVKP